MDKPVKTLFVDVTMGMGGAERIQQSLIMGFDRKRIEPVVALFYNSGIVGKELSDAGVKVYDGLGSGKFDLGITRSLARIMKDEKIQVVHSCNYPLVMVHTRLAMMMSGVKHLVVGLHSIGYARRAGWRDFALKSIRPFVTKFVTISIGQKRHYIQTCGLRNESFETIYNGIDIKRFSPSDYDRSARTEFNIPEDAYAVGILAALRPEKRHDLFLKIARKVRDVRKDVFFLIIGDGPERGKIESIVQELDLSDCVKLTGTRTDAPHMLRALDISVLTSAPVVETMPVSLIESMAMELPVVSTKVGSIDEIVGEGVTGFLTPEGDADAFSAKLLELLQNPDMARQMGQAGRCRVEELFTKETMIEHYEDLFERLAMKRGGK